MIINRAGASVYIKNDMEMFDRLPRPVRQFLANECAENVSCLQAYQVFILNDRDTQRTLDVLENNCNKSQVRA